MTSRSPYGGTSRKLVVSIDVGTTYSASSFCILQNGKVPKFEEVLRWPKQAIPDAKVPSVLYYDGKGCARSFGAETEDDDMMMQADAEKWRFAEWWKLYLRPAHLPIIQNLDLPKLPSSVTVDKIFSDFLRYIKDQVQAYIIATYGDGKNIWEDLSPSMYVILTTPNGWEGSQQNRMRNAAIAAGLVDVEGGRRVRFVTEAEAAVLFAAESGCVDNWLTVDGHLILCDCGGGTIDITGYNVMSVKPLRLEETAASRCYLAGAVFVTRLARAYIQKHLKGSAWDKKVIIEDAVQQFDKNAKRKFEDPEAPSWIKIDGHSSSPKLGIQRGRLKISGKDMASFFEPSLQSIKEGLENAFENGGRLADKVILVGGLASSPYVYSQLIKWGEEFGVSVSRPDGPSTKAVANGALAWYIDSAITARFSKYHYGARASIPYDEHDKDAQQRSTYINLDGSVKVGDAWTCIVEKNEKIAGRKEFFHGYCRQLQDTDDFECSLEIYVYRRSQPPKFMTFPGKVKLQPGFEKICTVKANLEECYKASPVCISPASGVSYRTVNFEGCISLGDTEISARLRWKENDKWTYSPAIVSYE